MQMKCFLPEPRFPLEPRTVANGVGTAAMLERSTLRLLLCVVQLMVRRLSSPAMGRLEVVVDGGGARCAGGWKASLSAQRVCRELPWQGPGPHSSSMTACADRARWLTSITAHGQCRFLFVGSKLGCHNRYISLTSGLCVRSMDAG